MTEPWGRERERESARARAPERESKKAKELCDDLRKPSISGTHSLTPNLVRLIFRKLLHYLFVSVLLLWPMICWQYKWVHTTWAAASFAAACYQGIAC